MAQQERTSYDATPPGRAINMDNLAAGGPEIDVVHEMDPRELQELIDSTTFMNEPVGIIFHDTGDENSPKMVELGASISGTTGKMRKDTEGNMRPGVAGPGGKLHRLGFLRNKVYTVPRYMVEIAAHAKVVTLARVENPNPNNPEPIYTERHMFAYPFSVVRDPNPKGKAWLEARMNDPA